jgi:NitT/TauT family transport system ATP-binding protein
MIRIENLTVAYGGNPVIENCSLCVPTGNRAALMGPSGCGKTTLLGVTAGLIKPQSGNVQVDGRISYVFQEPRLFPWLTAEQNISIVLPCHEQENSSTALLWLERAGLGESRDKYPDQLSGGMRQRLAICRALAYGGDVLLLDEPLKGMDAPLRSEISSLILENSAGKTLLVVTHDEQEAAHLADTVYEYRDKKFVER